MSFIRPLRFATYLIWFSAVLGSYFLNERLGVLGKLGCAMCLLGSVIIVLHAPPDTPVETIDDILRYALTAGLHLKPLALLMILVHPC